MNRNLAVVNRRGGEKEASRRSDTPTERTVQVQQARTLEVMVRAELATRVARLVSESLAARSRD